jgi:hypothetical protein
MGGCVRHGPPWIGMPVTPYAPPPDSVVSGDVSAPNAQVLQPCQASSSATGMMGKKTPSDQTPNQSVPSTLRLTQIDEPVEAFPVDQRLEPRTDMDVRAKARPSSSRTTRIRCSGPATTTSPTFVVKLMT